MLSDEQQHHLKQAVEKYAPTLVSLASRDAVALPLDERNQLRIALTTYLTAVGFDDEWNPTPLGRDIEQLIDILGPK